MSRSLEGPPGETAPPRSTTDASWQEGQRFPSEFVGLWLCNDGSFYDGSTIEIASNHWCPLRPTGAVQSSAVYTWKLVDGRCQLVDTRESGESHVYDLSSCPDGTLKVTTQSESWYLVSERKKSRRTSTTFALARRISEATKMRGPGKTHEILEQVSQTKGMPVCLLLATVSIFVCVFLIGIFEEDWHIITAMYMLTQCILTIGFGDVTVTHDMTKLSLSVLVLSSLVLIAFVAKEIGDVLVRRNTLRATTRVAALGKTIVEATCAMSPRSTSTTADDDENFDVTKILVGVTPAVCCLAFGTIFYATYEACTCSYGPSRVPDCSMDSYEACVETGGYVKTWVDSFYMSVMALTTTGLGDVSPMSEFGRAVGIVWMILGVASMAHMIQEIASYLFKDEQENMWKETAASLDEVFDIVDQDGDGTISRNEFRWFVLLKHNLVNEDVLDSIDRTFDAMAVERGKSPLASAITFDNLEIVKARRGRGNAVSRELSEDV